jgi:hypothetical protein
MAIDLSAKTVEELKTIIANHEKLGKVKAERYLAAGVELAGRSAGNLSLDKTVGIITAAAKEGVFLGYKDVADRSGAVWAKVHYAMTKHLLDVSRHAHRLGWPLLSAIVVNKQHVANGTMEPETLAAFCNCARDLGMAVEDEAEFLKAQQAAVFAAAKEGRLG